MKPLVGGDYFAATLPQWLAFQAVAGVAKVWVLVARTYRCLIRTITLTHSPVFHSYSHP